MLACPFRSDNDLCWWLECFIELNHRLHWTIVSREGIPLLERWRGGSGGMWSAEWSLLAWIKARDFCLTECSSVAECGSKTFSSLLLFVSKWVHYSHFCHKDVGVCFWIYFWWENTIILIVGLVFSPLWFSNGCSDVWRLHNYSNNQSRNT